MSDELLRDVRSFVERMGEHPLQRDGAGEAALPRNPTLVSEWLTRPEWVHAEFEASLLVARALDSDVAPRLVRLERDALLSRLETELTPWHALEQLGFAGDRDNYGALDNSRIDRILECRRGIPITLAIVLLEAARFKGFSAIGLNHPGHFLVQVEQDLIDPFSLRPLSEPEVAAAAPLATPQGVLLRMLNNVKAAFQQAQRWDRALDMVSLQLAVLPNQPELWCEKGDLWARLGGLGGASRAYREALDGLSDDHPLAGVLRERLQRIGRQSQETLH